MGRAIDMENRIDNIKIRIDKIDAALEKVINVVDEMQKSKLKKTSPVDIEDAKKQYKGSVSKKSAKAKV